MKLPDIVTENPIAEGFLGGALPHIHETHGDTLLPYLRAIVMAALASRMPIVTTRDGAPAMRDYEVRYLRPMADLIIACAFEDSTP